MKNTPGPWKIDGAMTGPRCAQALFWEHPNYREPEAIIHITGKAYEDCPDASPLVAVLPCRDDIGNSADNARLIAAAPEMFEALCMIIDSDQWDYMESSVQDAVVRAVARAEKGGVE